MYKILIIEDDSNIREIVAKRFKQWGYDVTIVKDFQNVMNDFYESNPHLLIIDITLPFYNGYYWCQEIRKVSKVPIIFLSSANENMNIVMAMNTGGDDYITKPFDLGVLEAKVQAILRRSYDFISKTELLEFSELSINIGEMKVLYKDKSLDLSKNEFMILEELAKNKGKVVSRNQLMQKLWNSDLYIDDNTLTVNIARIRKKLEEIGAINIIKTKKGIGYYVE